MLNVVLRFIRGLTIAEAIKKCDIKKIESVIESGDIELLRGKDEKVFECLVSSSKFEALRKFCQRSEHRVCKVFKEKEKVILVDNAFATVITKNDIFSIPLNLATILEGTTITREEIEFLASLASIKRRIDARDLVKALKESLAILNAKGLLSETRKILPQIDDVLKVMRVENVKVEVESDLPRAELTVYPSLKNTCTSWVPEIGRGVDPISKLFVLSAKKEGICDCKRLRVLAERIGLKIECARRKPEDVVVTSYEYLSELRGNYESAYLDRPFTALLYGIDVERLKKILKTLNVKRVKVRSVSEKARIVFGGAEVEIINAPRVKAVAHEPAGYRDVRIIFGYSTSLEGEYFATRNKVYLKMLGLSIANEKSKRVIIPSTYDLQPLGKVEHALNALRESFLNSEIYLVHKKPGDVSEELETVSVERREVKLTPLFFSNEEEGLREVERRVRKVWGFELRDYQRLALYYLIQPYAGVPRPPLTFIILPTGSGKSLIFQSLALTLHEMFGGTTVVISPLLALIDDQVESLKRRGIEVCKIDGSVSARQRERCLERLRDGKVPLVYLTPEQVEKEEVREAIRWADINYVVVDEAHSASRWGRTFRPSYLFALEFLRKEMKRGKNLPIAFFSATLPEKELKFILDLFEAKEYERVDDFGVRPPSPVVIKGPIIRENIKISGERVRSVSDRLKVLLERVKELSEWADAVGKPWIGLIFTSFVKSNREYENAEEIAKYLEAKLGTRVLVYHGQMSKKAKRSALGLLYEVSEGKRDEPRIVVATKAFGMGIDIPNIRWIIHFIVSDSVEDYYQEVGRGGRDGLPVRAHLLYVPGYDEKRKFALLRRQMLRPRFVYEIWKKIGGGGFFSADYFAGPLRRVTVEFESALERSLYILSNLGAIDYQVMRSAECGKCYLIKKLRDVGEGEIEVAVRNFNLSEVLKVRTVLQLARLISSGEINAAINVIKRYLELGDDYGKLELKGLIEIIKRIAESNGIVMRDSGNEVEVVTSRRKNDVMKGTALAITYIVLRDKMIGARVSVPWGMGEGVKRRLNEIEETLRLDLNLHVEVYKDNPKGEVVVERYKKKGEHVILKVKRL